MTNGGTKSIAEVIEDLKQDLQDFAATRIGMLRSELHEKLQAWKMALPVLIIGIMLLATAWLVLTGFLISIVAAAFSPAPWSYTVSFLIVGMLYGIIGAAAAYLAWRQLKEKGLKPERTIKVLKEDRIWLQTEAKTQL